MFLPNRSRSNKDKAELIRSFSKDVMPGFKNKALKPIIDRVVKVDWKDITPVKTEKKIPFICSIPPRYKKPISIWRATVISEK